MKITTFSGVVLACIISLTCVLAYQQNNYTSNGSYVVPDNVTVLIVQAWGGGGGGGAGAFSSGDAGGGGGGGGAYASSLINVTPGDTWTMIYGSPGAGGESSGDNGSDALDTVFFKDDVNVTAAGGKGGEGTAFGVGGLGGKSVDSVGNLFVYSGGNGFYGDTATGGGGGGGAGTSSNGVSSSSRFGGSGGALYGGNGGTGYTGGEGSGGGGNSRSGGGGAASNGAIGTAHGGNGGAGLIIVNAFNSTDHFGYLQMNVYNTNGEYINTVTNVTLISITGSNTEFYSFNNSLFVNGLPSGTYLAMISADGFSSNRYLVSVPNAAVQTANFYVDSSASFSPTYFHVLNMQGTALENITITFSRYIDGTITAYSQVRTDFSGAFSLYLNPYTQYYMSSIDETGTYTTRLDNIIPIPGQTYDIFMNYAGSGGSGGSGYVPVGTGSLTDTFYNAVGSFDNDTNTALFSFEVTNLAGGLEYFSLSTVYDGTTYYDNFTTPPTGGIINLSINPVDLATQRVFSVHYTIKNTNFSEYNFNYTYSFTGTSANNGSITGGLFTDSTLPVSLTGRTIIGVVILIIILSGMITLTGSMEATVVIGMAVIGLFGFIGLFPLLASIIVLAVGSIIFVGDAVANR